MLTKSEYLEKVRNKKIDTDGVPGKQPYQCADLVKDMLNHCWGIKNFSFALPGKNPDGYVKSIWENFNDYPQLRGKAVKIKNTPNFTPALGDFVVWKGNAKNKNGKLITGKEGHIAVAEGINTGLSSFTSMDQNWGGKHYCSDTVHSYDGIYGVIRMLEKCTTTDLNIRSGPSIRYTKIGEYPKGTLVKPLIYSGNWVQTADGWVSSKYLE